MLLSQIVYGALREAFKESLIDNKWEAYERAKTFVLHETESAKQYEVALRLVAEALEM